jgi:hypothetical protein
MTFSSLYLRFRWLQVPTGLLIVLLQRMPVLRLLTQAELTVGENGGAVIKSVFALAAFGAYNSVAGATTFGVSPATPSTGVVGTTFAISGTAGTAMTETFTLTGAPGSPKAWSVTGTLPTGLSVTGGNPINVTAPYKMTITGTPSAAGSWSVTVIAWESSGATGKSVSCTCTFTITGGTTNVAPSFTTQPTSASVNVGGSVTFTSAASGTPAPTYQWYRGTTALTGQTAASLSLSNVQTTDAGSYTVVATNSAGTATSNAATLTVTAVAPSITTQPQNATATVGNSVTLSVVASGTAPLTYQWKKGTTSITGATLASYTISSVQTTDAGSYTVTVTNSAGSVTSSAATLTVSSAPSITSQPQSTSVVAGSSASFSVTATGSAPLSYQWQKGGTAISGATSSTYTIASAQTTDAGSYTVVVTNGSGSVTSTAATLTVSASAVAPSITTQPQSSTVTVGSAATFTVAASGTAPLTYQWRKGGTAISGATSATYSIASAQAADAGSYTVVVTNGAGSVTSAAATLTVNPAPVAPVITTQPTSHSVASGHDVSFSVVATGYPTPTYAWSVSANSGTSWTAVSSGTNYSGATTATLTVKSATTAQSGYLYRCVVTNSSGSATSNNATLTVISAIFPAPSGLAVVASSGVLTVADSSNNTIQTVGTNWAVSALAGAAGQQGSTDGTGVAALFRQPNGVAQDSAGNVYIADTGNSLIRKVTAAGVVTTLAGSSSNQAYRDGVGTAAWFNASTALTIDSLGNVFVADTANSVIRKIATDGTVTTLAGTAGSTGSADGTSAAARFNQPAGIIVDSAGNLYVSDTNNHTIRKVTSAGVVTTLAGLAGVSGSSDGTGTAAQFNLPRGLCYDGSGNLYVADTANSSIRKVTTAGVVTTFAGLSTVSGLLDGTGIESWFNQPRDVKIDSSGNLYVADTGNAAIRKITAAGVVTTPSLTVSSSSGSSSSSSSSSSSGSSSEGPPPGKSGAGDIPAWFGAGWLVLLLSRWFWIRSAQRTTR